MKFGIKLLKLVVGVISVLKCLTIGVFVGCCFTSCLNNKGLDNATLSEETVLESEKVFICTGRYSKRYHSDEYCKGLMNCSGDVRSVSLQEAEEMGKTPCRYCY